MTPLRRARELLTDPAHWTQGGDARTSMGERTSALDPAATCWCLEGSLVACRATRRDFRQLDRAVRDRSRNSWITAFNDNRSHAEVLAVLDDAIAKETP